jgi:hypothetical protein
MDFTLNIERENAIKNGIQELFEFPSNPDGHPEYRRLLEREKNLAPAESDLNWINQDLCGKIFLITMLASINKTQLHQIIEQHLENNQSSVQELLNPFTPPSLSISEDVIFRITGTPKDNLLEFPDINKKLRLDLRSSTLEVLTAMDYLPVSWRYKLALLNGIKRIYLTRSELPLQKTRVGRNIGDRSRRNLNSFERINRGNSEEVAWSAEYFLAYLLENYGSFPERMVLALKQAKQSSDRENKQPDLSFIALRAAFFAWGANRVEVENFDMRYSRALSQRRHRAKNTGKVPLNTKISPEAKNQLKKLATRKQKTIYEVLEELIYQEFHRKK